MLTDLFKTEERVKVLCYIMFHRAFTDELCLYHRDGRSKIADLYKFKGLQTFRFLL